MFADELLSKLSQRGPLAAKNFSATLSALSRDPVKHLPMLE